ncbi:thymidine phosphorylase [Leptolyngbya sp. 7M]|uniref:thymidine phosphorylase n=1 Tax=Leptolyngbya sp. 7M TaxID=2812896 RepID=UPI001B8BA290|nr:thymidine phosphorylase [Leptolyngbya sp. 7M]QYO65719.1 thymidine phosphorylase [Leptolyngbya sp. 7M]
MMRPQEMIAIKRDGGELSREQIEGFIDGVCDGSWADYQISAFLMAMFTRGLSEDEQNALTNAMLHSGDVLDLASIDLPKADKHSTGGVGDKTSLIIAPAVAACGVAVPMISGRGLGHTGGTLDKLESIPGYRINLSNDEFRSVLDKCGFAMTGQTDQIVPADKKLYALRDATATVPYIPLIVASIMSKKLAEGLDALILDVKTGSGAFMTNPDDAVYLARAMVRTGKEFGVRTQAIVSDMDQPLGRFVGNACEVFECLNILRGEDDERSADLKQLSVELSARMLILTGVEADIDIAKKRIEDAITIGAAYEKFEQNCYEQGGEKEFCRSPKQLLDSTLDEFIIRADKDGYVSTVDALAIGEAVVSIGGGRRLTEDSIDHGVGYSCEVKIGNEVRYGDVLGVLYCRGKDQAKSVSEKLNAAYRIDEQPTSKPELIKAVIDA